MQVIISLLLFLAYTAAVGFGGFLYANKKYAAERAVAQTAADRIRVVTKNIEHTRIQYRDRDRVVFQTLAAQAEQEIKDAPAIPQCPPADSGLWNRYVEAANGAGELPDTSTRTDELTQSSYGGGLQIVGALQLSRNLTEPPRLGMPTSVGEPVR